MDEIRREDLPKVVEKRALDAHVEAWILENGSVIIVNSVGGIETLLTAERAYNLLSFLSNHGMRLLHILRPRSLTLDWQKSEGRLLACLQKAYSLYGNATEEAWRVVVVRSTLPGITPGDYTPKGLLDLVTGTAEQEDIATLFYDDQYQGQRYEGKLVFASLYLEHEHTDQPYCLFYRLEEQAPH